MEYIKKGERIRYYRDLLKVSRKELGYNRLSVDLIYRLEAGKKKLTIPTAVLLADNFNEIAKIKGIDLNLSLEDLMVSEREYVERICKQQIEEYASEEYNEENYLKTLKLAEKYGTQVGIFTVVEAIGTRNYNEGRCETAVKYLDKAYEIAYELKLYEKEVAILNRISTSKYKLDDYDSAIDDLNKCFSKINEYGINDDKLKGNVLFNLALYYNRLDMNEKALQYLNKLNELEQNEEEIHQNKFLEANIYLCLKKYEKALKVYKDVLEDKKEDCMVYHNMAILYSRMDKREESIEYLNKSISIQLNNLSKKTTVSLEELGKNYINKKGFKEAIICFENAIKNAKVFNQFDRIIEYYKILYQIYEEINKPEEFSNYLEDMLKLIKDNSKNEKLKLDITMILFEYVAKANQLALSEMVINKLKEGIDYIEKNK